MLYQFTRKTTWNWCKTDTSKSEFVPGDMRSNRLLFLINEIHEAFDDTKFLEVRAVSLDISTAFDNMRHYGLIFKLRHVVSGKLLIFVKSYSSNRNQRVSINDYPVCQVDSINSGKVNLQVIKECLLHVVWIKRFPGICTLTSLGVIRKY